MHALAEDDNTPDATTVQSAAVGSRLRELRENSGMSLRELARQLGITPSAVSQIERGAKQPSVNRLLAIVTALGVPLTDVFSGGVPASTDPADTLRGRVITRRADTAPVELEDGVIFRRLSPGAIDGIDFFESIYPPLSRASSQNALLRHEGYEVGTVVSGQLTVEFENEIVVLSSGDSITFSCSDPHLIRNASAEATAVATWLIVHS